MQSKLSQLDKLENQSIFIIREAFSQFKNVAILWSIGKDSTTLLWLVRKAFFGKPPFPALHIDTTYKFKEIYDFREKYAKEWDLDLVVAKNEEALAAATTSATGLSLEIEHLEKFRPSRPVPTHRLTVA